MPNLDRRVTLGIFGNITDIRAKLGWVKSEKASLERDGINVPVDAETKKATISLDDLRAQLKKLNGQVSTARANVNDKEGTAKLDALNLKLTRLSHLDTRTRISVTGAAKALAELSAVDAALERINEKSEKAGRGGGFLSGISGTLTGLFGQGSALAPTLSNPYVAGGLAGVGAAAAPFVGQAAAGVGIAGLGAGLAGVGVLGAVGAGGSLSQADVMKAQGALKVAQARERAAQVANSRKGTASTAATLAGAQNAVTTAQTNLETTKGDALTPGQQSVRNSFTRLAANIKKDLASIGTAFQPVLRTIASTAQSTFARLTPVLAGAMRTMAGPLRSFTTELIRGFSSPQMVAMINAIAKAFGAILKALAPALPGLMNQLANAITAIANSVAKNPQALVGFINFLFHVGIYALNAINALTVAANWLENDFIPILRKVFNPGSSFYAPLQNGIRGAANSIRGSLSGAVNYIRGAWASARNSTVNTWNSIRSFIVGAAHAIAGFLGSTWRGIQGMASNALHAIAQSVTSRFQSILAPFRTWALVTLGIWGNAWRGIRNLTSAIWPSIRTFLLSALNGIRSNFNAALGAVRSAVSVTWRAISSTTRAIWNAIRTYFVNTWNNIRVTFAGPLSVIRALVRFVWGIISSQTRQVWNGLRTYFSAIWAVIHGIFSLRMSAVRNLVSSGWNAIHNTTVSVFNRISNFFSGFWRGIRSGFSGLVSDLSRIWHGIESIFSVPVRWVSSHIYNPFAGFVNRGLGVFGIKSRLPIMKFAAGGVVPGNTPGRDNHVIAVSGGEGILTPEATQALGGSRFINLANRVYAGYRGAGRGGDGSGYALGGIIPGGGVLHNIVHAVTGAASRVGHIASTGWQDITGAIAGIGRFVGNLAHVPGSGIIHDLITAVIRNMLNSAKGSLNPGNALGGFFAHMIRGGGSGVGRWAGTVSRALSMLGLSQSLAGRVLYQMQTESGGNPNAINNWDINARNGDPSRGLLQTIGATFRAFHVPGTSWNIFDPLANIAAAINYARHRYGPTLISGGMGMGSGHGYWRGTRSATRGWHLVGERGPEWLNFNGGESVAPAGSNVTYVVNVNIAGHALASKQEIGREVSSALATFKGKGGRV